MNWTVCISTLFLYLHGCMSNVVTEYKYLQRNGYIPTMDLLHCQLRANGNSTCALRYDTKTTPNGALEERERCEQLDVNWCETGVMEPGFVYVGKSAVYQTPPFTFYAYSGTSEIWEMMPILAEPGALVTIKTVPPATWSRMRLNYRDEAKQDLYIYHLHNSATIQVQARTGGSVQMVGVSTNPTPTLSHVMSTVITKFEVTGIRLIIDGTSYFFCTYREPPQDIRILQFVFFGDQGEIHLVSYNAADW